MANLTHPPNPFIPYLPLITGIEKTLFFFFKPFLPSGRPHAIQFWTVTHKQRFARQASGKMFAFLRKGRDTASASSLLHFLALNMDMICGQASVIL